MGEFGHSVNSSAARAQNDDPLFQAFLWACRAREVVPIRRGFEDDVRYFLFTGGRQWHSKPLPDAHDQDYLNVAEEIETSQDPDIGGPGDSWNVTVH